nr:uncharacterized protein LOC123758265 [Procambarus clarkii]
MGDPSKKCEQNFHQLHRLLTCFEESASIRRQDRWVIVRTVRELLKSLPTASSNSLLQDWLTTRQEALISMSIHFLKLIVIASRKVKYVKLVESALEDDLKLLHGILGNQGKLIAMVALRAGAIITEGQGLSYICQAQVFGTIAREVVKGYLTGVNPDSEEDVWWSILLFRLWLLSCGGEAKVAALREILAILPRKVSRRILGLYIFSKACNGYSTC